MLRRCPFAHRAVKGVSARSTVSGTSRQTKLREWFGRRAPRGRAGAWAAAVGGWGGGAAGPGVGAGRAAGLAWGGGGGGGGGGDRGAPPAFRGRGAGGETGFPPRERAERERRSLFLDQLDLV